MAISSKMDVGQGDALLPVVMPFLPLPLGKMAKLAQMPAMGSVAYMYIVQPEWEVTAAKQRQPTCGEEGLSVGSVSSGVAHTEVVLLSNHGEDVDLAALMESVSKMKVEASEPE